MKHFNLLLLFVSSILAFAPTVKTTALDDEVEIELMEVAGFLPGAYIVSILQGENKYVKTFIKQ